MAHIGDILKGIPGDVDLQFLHQCMTSAKEKKRDKCTEISFVTTAVNTSDLFASNKKLGIVIWVDTEDYNSSLQNLQNK